MHRNTSARYSTRRGALSIILLVIVLTQTSWVMYSTITAFEVDIDHGRSPSWDLVLGVAALGEMVGILFIFFRREPGFIFVISAESLRAFIALLTRTSSDNYLVLSALIDAGLLIYLYVHFGDDPGDVQADRTPPDLNVGSAAERGDRERSLEVFLSYSRRQFYFAESLMLRLERNAISVWFDTRRIQAGVDWRKSMDQGLSTCTSLVVVASRDALASQDVNYEWRTALACGKRIYVVLFEAVELPPELSREAVAIIDMRTRFEPKAMTLVNLLVQPRHYRDKAATGNALRLPLRQPPSTSLVTIALTLTLAASLFFDVLNFRTLVAITTPHGKNIPEESDVSFTTHLLGYTFHGLSSKVYAFLGIAAVTLLLTTITAFLLVAIIYRRRFALALLPLALLGPGWLYLNTSFINHSTNHVIVSISGGLMSTPANLHSSAWRDFYDMILGRYVKYSSSSSFDYGSPFLSVGDAAPFLTTTSAHWRWPTLALLVLGAINFLVAQRSGSLYRWLATGSAPEKLRFQHNGPPNARSRTRRIHSGSTVGPLRYPDRSGRPETLWSGGVEQQKPLRTASEQPLRWHLLHHPADYHVAAEIETALAECVHSGGESLQRRDVSIVLLTNHTQVAWLGDLERNNPDLIYVICTTIQPDETLKRLHRYQWFDYRERSYDKLVLLGKSLQASSSASVSYSFPALPEGLTRMVMPGPVRYKSHSMRLFSTWLLAITLFGQGNVYSSFVHDEGLGRLVPALAELMFWISIPCCLYLFWLAVELASSRTTYARFQRRLNVVMVALLITQLQFLLSFDDQFGIVLLGTLINVFMAIIWFTPDAGQIQRWLPAEQSRATSTVGTLAVPLWRQYRMSSMIYLALFVFCYSSGVIFFADVA
ncbi:toll/interleukin-1 receptor domain-containing protein [Nonomuraea sp. NPDC023979]|uniref:toll/interleukin-1 receptor domain-containing protein n=1 Tax=Nonomuraea sp. NPDC023979 TaxID=3154796 RepID=UPI0033D98508